MQDAVELPSLSRGTPSYRDLSNVSGSAITPPSHRSIHSDDGDELPLPQPAVAQDRPQLARDCSRWCLAVAKSTLVGGFVGTAAGGATLGLMGAVAFGLGGAYMGGLIGTCLEALCPPFVHVRVGHAAAPGIVLV